MRLNWTVIILAHKLSPSMMVRQPEEAGAQFNKYSLVRGETKRPRFFIAKDKPCVRERAKQGSSHIGGAIIHPFPALT